MFKKHLLRQAWLDLPIGRKLLFFMVGILGIVTITISITTFLFFSLTKNFQDTINDEMEAWFAQHEIKDHIYARNNAVLEYLLTGDERFLEQFESSSRIAKDMEQFVLNNTPSSQQDEVRKFIEKSQDWEFILRNKVIPVYELGNYDDALLTMIQFVEPIAQDLIASVNQFSAVKESEIRAQGEKTIQQSEKAMLVKVLLIILTVVVSLFLSWILTRSFTIRIKNLYLGTRRLSVGEFGYQVPIYGKDELGQLGEAFNLMGTKLQSLVEQLNQTNKQLRIESCRAKEATRLKSEFLATMSHELRTPLNGVLGFSEVLEEGYYGELNPKQSEYVHYIKDNGKHLLSLINDILDLSKVEAGKIDFELTNYDVESLFANALIVIREKAKRQGISLHFENKSLIKTMALDPKRVTQILHNLLSNAIKFTPRGGSVGIEIDEDQDFLIVSIWDTGIGIRSERLEKIFQPFYQDEANYDRRFEGTGLGLALTQKMVHLHGGNIKVESEYGKGSNFTFTLPKKPWEHIIESIDHPFLEATYYPEKQGSHEVSVWLINGKQFGLDHFNTNKEEAFFVENFNSEELKVNWGSGEQNLPQLIVYIYKRDGISTTKHNLEWAEEMEDYEVPIIVLSLSPLTLKERGTLFKFAREVHEIPLTDLVEKDKFRARLEGLSMKYGHRSLDKEA